MKKKNISKQISKILAVGISATLSFQPLTVLAMEGNASFDDQAEAALESVEYTSEALVSDTDITYIPEVSEDNGPSAETATQEEHDLISEIIVDADAATTDSSTDENLYDLATDKLEEADGHLDAAATALDTAQSRNAAIENYNAALDAAEDTFNKIVDNPEGDSINTGVLIEGRETLSPFTGRDITIEPGKANVHQFANNGEGTAAGYAYDAIAEFDGGYKADGKYVKGSSEYAQDAIAGYDVVTNDSTAYVSSGVDGDSTGQLLKRIENDAASADKNLEDAKDAFERADAELLKAETEYTKADIAYEDAYARFASAKEAYEKISEPRYNESSTKTYITSAKRYLDQAKSDFEEAKADLETARIALDDKIEALNSAQYEELLAKRNAIDEAKTEEARASASDSFAKAVIKYFYKAEKGADITVPDNMMDFDYKDIIPIDALSADGTKYISGYDEEYQPIFSSVPKKASVYRISYADAENEDPKDHYFIFTFDGAQVDLTEYVFSNGEGVTEQVVETPGQYKSDGKVVDIDDAKYLAKVTTMDGVVHVSELDKKVGQYELPEKPVDTSTVRYLKVRSGSEEAVYMTDDVIVGDDQSTARRSGFVVEEYETLMVQERTKTVVYMESPEYTWVSSDGQRWFAADEVTANDMAESLNEEHTGYRHHVLKEWDTNTQSYVYYIYQKQISNSYISYGRWNTVKNGDGTDRTINVTTSKVMYESIDCTYEEGESKINYLKYYNPGRNDSKMGGEGSVLDVNGDNGYAAQQNYNELLNKFKASDLAYRNAEEALGRAIADVNALTATKKKKAVDAQQALEAAQEALDQAYLEKWSAFAALSEAVSAMNAADEIYWDANVKKIQAYDALGQAQKAYRDKYKRDPYTPRRSYTVLAASYDPEEETSTNDETQDTTVTSTLMAAAPMAEMASVLGETRPIAGSAKTMMTAAAVVADEEEVSETDKSKETNVVQEEDQDPEKQEEVKSSADITDDDTAKAGAPIVMATHFAWGWVTLILAAGAGVAAEEYVRRKNVKDKAGN